MDLSRNLLFHNRYVLISALGSGASAEVWKAKDTKANNLIVALKIFSQHSEMDSTGLQNFEQEFTTVYNMKQSNLLPPTGYDIFDGYPYLVMQYCENGSCSSMVGRMEENDIIKFLHDVSAGLEYLHDHNIIHQDIKPDNILLDDNCNFMVTDFGISVTINNGIYDSNGMSGGTRAYMGPERFSGITNSASDMWSLGATAVELLTGNPPYGEHGGLLQSEGEPLPELPKLQPEVRDMILRCLEQDPSKRIRANEIRQKIELFWETGSWVKRSRKQTAIMIITAVVAALMCLGIFLWDYNRTKVYYYKDYAEYFCVPKGIGRLSANEVKHRESSYRFEYKKRKVRRLALVNSAGKVVTYMDTELKTSRFSDVYYYYTDDGKIDYEIIYNQNGCVLFKLDYDENLKTATFRQNDEFGTEMNLDANVNVFYKQGTSAFDEKSRISRYLLSYDEKGLLEERKYAGLQNVPACDQSNIYGQRYKYDNKGRKIEEDYIGANGEITSNSDGLAIRVFTYDKNDNWSSVSYLNVLRKGSHDGNNCSIMKLEYDKYGNRIKESYYTFDGTPAIRTDCNVSGYNYTYDKNGFLTLQSNFDVSGKPSYSSNGFVTIRDSCNSSGFIVKREFLDENNNPVLFSKDVDVYSSVTYSPNETGLPLDVCFYDNNGIRMEESNGVSHYKWTYDKNGNLIDQKVFDKNDKPTAADGFFYEMKVEYDAFNHVTRERYYDTNGRVTTSDGTVAEYRMEYNRQGAFTKISFYDIKGALVEGTGSYAGYSITYDDVGNKKDIQYFNAENKHCMSISGYSKIEYEYDPKSNFLTVCKYFDSAGSLLSSECYDYDAKGNIIKTYTLTGSVLKKGTAVEKKKYNISNKVVKVWYCDLNGNNINSPGTHYSQIKYEYDAKGNCTSTSYWDVNGKPAVDAYQTHISISGFDMMNRMVRQKYLGVDGKPLTGSDKNPEARVKYDQWGNQVEISCYDGYGKPRLSSDGFFALRTQYDMRRNIIHEEYVGINGKYIISKNGGYAKADYSYDKHGNLLLSKYYGTSGCIRIEKWKYNGRNELVERCFCDANGRPSDKFFGFSKFIIEYDKAGVHRVIKKYINKDGVVLGTQLWNTKKGDWDEIKITGHSSSGSVNSTNNTSSNWQAVVRNDAGRCPQQLSNGIFAQSISYTSSSVTITLKLIEVSKYNLGDSEEQTIREQMLNYKTQFRKTWALPSNVSLSIVVHDKADRIIITI